MTSPAAALAALIAKKRERPMPDEPMPLSDDDLGLLRTHSADGRRLNAHTLSDAIDHALATIAFQSARIAALTEALARADAMLVLAWDLHDAIEGEAVPNDIRKAAVEICERHMDHPNVKMLDVARARVALSQPAPGSGEEG